MGLSDSLCRRSNPILQEAGYGSFWSIVSGARSSAHVPLSRCNVFEFTLGRMETGTNGMSSTPKLTKGDAEDVEVRIQLLHF